MNEHVQVGAGQLQPRPWGKGTTPLGEGDRIDERLKEVYETNTSLILGRHQEGNVCSFHFSNFEIMQAGNAIYDRQNKVFRLNLEFGLILKK